MATEAQVRANRLNAQKSTGPRTEAGKAVVAQNAVRHGLLAEKTVISGEDPGQFESYRAQLLAELHPAGAMEAILAERIVGLAWRLRRADRLQAEVFDTLLARDGRPLARSIRASDYSGSEDGPDPRDSALGRVTLKDFTNYRVIDRLGTYERRIEYSLYRTMAELEKVRRLRTITLPAETPNPEPAETAADESSCETKPISPAADAGTANADRTPPRPTPADRMGQADSDGHPEDLTRCGDGHRLVGVGISAPAASVRHGSGPPWGTSHIGKEESR